MESVALPSGAHLFCFTGDINGIPMEPSATCPTCPECDGQPISIPRLVTIVSTPAGYSVLLVCAESDDSATPIPHNQPNLSTNNVALILAKPRDKQRIIQLLHEKHPVFALEQLKAESITEPGAPHVMVRPRFMRIFVRIWVRARLSFFLVAVFF